MAEIQRMPSVIVHEVALGGVLSGVAPDGVDTIETLYRGRYRKWTACTVAGLITMPAATFRTGWGLDRIMWNMTGIGSVTVNIVDEDGFVYPLATVAAAAGTWVPPDAGGLIILPGWSLQLVGGAPLGADGRIVVYVGCGWNQSVFDMAETLGREEYPPAKTSTP